MIAIVLFMVAPATVSAQGDSVHVYKSIFGQDSTEWNEIRLQGAWGRTLVCKVYQDDDTIHRDEVAYRRIHASIWHDYIECYESYPLFMRETENHDKIYLIFKQDYPAEEYEVLVMDLTLQVGDTFLIKTYNKWDKTLNNLYPVVDSIYYDELGMKHLLFNQSRQIMDWELDISLEFIEGMGPSWGCFHQSVGEDYSFLSCYWRDGEHMFSFFEDHPYIDCLYWNQEGAVPQTVEGNYQLFPNPHRGITMLDNPEGHNLAIIVYDTQGRKRLEVITADTAIPIDMSGWESGVYIIQLMANGNVYFIKSVKR